MEKAKRGRPIGSVVRDNIQKILSCKDGLGIYEICKCYNRLFPPVDKASIQKQANISVKYGFWSITQVKEAGWNVKKICKIIKKVEVPSAEEMRRIIDETLAEIAENKQKRIEILKKLGHFKVLPS